MVKDEKHEKKIKANIKSDLMCANTREGCQDTVSSTATMKIGSLEILIRDA